MIQFQQVSKTYPNGVQALKNVSLKVDQGEFVAIIGLSGAGKSTLIKLVNKMIESTDGTLLVNDQNVSILKGKNLRSFRRKIGMVFQSFNLINRTSVINNVLAARAADMNFFRTLFGLYSKDDKLQALESLHKVGILEKAYIRADQLSGGQQQRVALARTLSQNPSIILADEPVASLDPITANQIMKDFEKINKEENITILVNMHHVDLALKYANRVIGINNGEIIYDGPSEKITEDLLKKTLCLKISNFFSNFREKLVIRRTMTLADGTEITKPKSYTLLSSLIILFIFIYFWNLIVSSFFQRFGFQFFITRIPNFFTILNAMVSEVNFSYFERVIDPLFVTIQISILGTFIGTLIALPIAFLASQNLMKNSKFPMMIKFGLSVIRTFPTLVYALLFSFIFGYGTFIGLLATIIFTFGIISKMMYEVIETIDLGPFIAIEASGASKLVAFRTSIIPQVIGRFYSIILYNFEINLRASAILGFVGAGGIGLILNDQMSLKEYGNVSMIVLSLLVVVIIVENISRFIRGKLS